MFRSTLALAFAALLSPSAGQAENDRHQVTIYSRAQPGAVQPYVFEAQAANPDYRINIPGYAVIRTVREMDIDKGRSRLQFKDVAAGIDPTTVRVKSLSSPDRTRVLEQDYRYDLVNTTRILQRYIDREIGVQQSFGEGVAVHRGRLLSADDRTIVLRQSDGGHISLSAADQNVLFPELPDGLITRPTLVWLIDAARSGRQEIEVSYETQGMTWWSDYNLVLDETAGCSLDVAAWVSIVNQSGGSYPAARLKLVAGEVNRASNRSVHRRPAMARANMAMAEESGFQEQAFFEYHLYTLGRPADLPDRSLKQLELFPSAGQVGCEKELLVASGISGWRVGDEPFTRPQQPFSNELDVQVSIHFQNTEDNHLGVPLPAGRIRVSKRDPADGNLEFIGEDLIEHTPRDERVSVALGNAFDVVAERRQADFSWSKNERWMTETIELSLRNRKQQATTLTVREPLYRWTNWRIEQPSHPFRKIDASTIEFQVDLTAGQETKLSYVARYTW